MKRIVLLAWAIVASLTSYAQEPLMSQTDSVDLNPYAVIDSLLSQLDMSNVSTGLLLDKSVPFAKIRNYTGQTGDDTVYSFYKWNDLYNTLKKSELVSNAGPPSADTWAGEVDNPVLTAKPYAWLKLRLINTSGATGFSINRPVGAEKGLQMGFVLDTTVYFLVWGNYDDDLGTFIYNGSSVTPNPFPFKAIGHDTTFYEIKY